MARYIDAELIDLGRVSDSICQWQAQEAIDDTSTADVVEVVRCKDCKHYLNSNEKCILIDTRLHFYETDKTWTSDCFCSWGERREDD